MALVPHFFFFFSSIVLNVLGLLPFLYTLKSVCLYLSDNLLGFFNWICIEYVDQIGKNCILRILCISTCEHRISFQFFVPFFISFVRVLWFIRFIFKCLMFGVIINGIVTFYFKFPIFTVIYSKVFNFCISNLVSFDFAVIFVC